MHATLKPDEKQEGSSIPVCYEIARNFTPVGGDFTFGRNFYATGHSLLLSDYVDAIKYYKRSGDVDVSFYTIYDRHVGNYKDFAAVDFRNVWGLTLGTKYRDHDLYLNVYGQDEPNRINQGVLPFSAIALSNLVAGSQTKDNLLDVEFGGKGPLGRTGHWDYDLGFAYTGYEAKVFNTAATTFSNIEMNGWLGHGAIKWDSKREWAAKLGYTFGDDKNVGAISLDNDRRYDDGIETPYEDISRGNRYFTNGLMNMYDLKLQVEYRPRNTKHYFRLAGDFLDELKDTVSNDMARRVVGRHTAGTADIGTAGASKTNTVYDRWNNFGIADAAANVFTFEYRYQLAENTRIRVGYTMFDFTGDYLNGGWTQTAAAAATGGGSVSVPANASLRAGRGFNGDYDYNTFWAELYSRF